MKLATLLSRTSGGTMQVEGHRQGIIGAPTHRTPVPLVVAGRVVKVSATADPLPVAPGTIAVVRHRFEILRAAATQVAKLPSCFLLLLVKLKGTKSLHAVASGAGEKAERSNAGKVQSVHSPWAVTFREPRAIHKKERKKKKARIKQRARAST